MIELPRATTVHVKSGAVSARRRGAGQQQLPPLNQLKRQQMATTWPQNRLQQAEAAVFTGPGRFTGRGSLDDGRQRVIVSTADTPRPVMTMPPNMRSQRNFRGGRPSTSQLLGHSPRPVSMLETISSDPFLSPKLVPVPPKQRQTKTGHRTAEQKKRPNQLYPFGLCLFDIDGTLVDGRAPPTERVIAALAALRAAGAGVIVATGRPPLATATV